MQDLPSFKNYIHLSNFCVTVITYIDRRAVSLPSLSIDKDADNGQRIRVPAGPGTHGRTKIAVAGLVVHKVNFRGVSKQKVIEIKQLYVLFLSCKILGPS
jgi:hypothetical protein